MSGSREAYARGYADEGDVEVTVGIELRDDDDFTGETWYAKRLCKIALNLYSSDLQSAAAYVEGRLLVDRPGRSYFVEVERDGGGVQIFDPVGWLKARCTCRCAGGD